MRVVPDGRVSRRWTSQAQQNLYPGVVLSWKILHVCYRNRSRDAAPDAGFAQLSCGFRRPVTT